MDEVELKELLDLYNGKAIKAQDEGKYNVYGSNGVIGRSNEYKYENAIIIGRVGAYCGVIHYERNKFWASDNTIVAIPKQRGIEAYCSYLLRFMNLRRYAGGAAQPLLTQITLNRLKARIPKDIPSRIKIGVILSTYDDLIENNNRRIKILEQIAQTIYDERFVKFRFPGYNKVKMVDSELGKIPEGWEVEKTGDVFETVLGGTPSRTKTEYWENGNIPWINSGKVNELRIIDESEFITELGLKKSATKLMPKRTTVLAITGATLGQVSLLEIEACANQSVVGIYDEEAIYNEYIYFKFCEIIQTVISKAGGGAQQHINKEIVNETAVILPSEQLIEQFNTLISPIFNLICNLLRKNKFLQETRDVLLPKLISGEIDVEDMDIDVGDVDDR